MEIRTVPPRPLYGKTRYKAIYRDPAQNPFSPRLTVPVKTVDIDATVPLAQVEQWARDAQENYEFVRLEIISQ